MRGNQNNEKQIRNLTSKADAGSSCTEVLSEQASMRELEGRMSELERLKLTVYD